MTKPTITIGTTIRLPMDIFHRRKEQRQSIQHDLARLSPDDLVSLKKSDPFLYHSIPSVHKATLALEDVDPSKVLIVDFPSDPRRRTRSSRSSECRHSSTMVTRRTQLTTECHFSVHLDELLGMSDEEFKAHCRDLDIDLNGLKC